MGDIKIPQEASLILSIGQKPSVMCEIFQVLQDHETSVIHVETRVCKGKETANQMLLQIQLNGRPLGPTVEALSAINQISSVDVLSESQGNDKEVWFPRHVSDLDNCNHLMTKFEPEMDRDHPGFADLTYRARRKAISEIAFSYKHGQPIPRVTYTEEDVSTWRTVFDALETHVKKNACSQYRDIFKLLKAECGYNRDNIPQLEDVSKFLQKKTGFVLRPVAGLLSARDFLASLAFRVFQCTQYVRHHLSPQHTPEPDCIHELLGHIPMLADPEFAEFSQELGLATLGASDEEITKFSTLYWFTVEFGLCKERDGVKAYGAGLLSSYGELEHALSDKPERRDFEPAATAIQPYQDQTYQGVYYVAQSFEDAKDKFKRWVALNMSRPYELRYNPHSQSIEVLDSVAGVKGLLSQVNVDINRLNNALNKMATGRMISSQA